MGLDGLGLSLDSGSANCDMPRSAVFGLSGGGKTEIATRPEMFSIPQIPYNASVASITFRNKLLGWKSYRMEIRIK